MSKLLTCAVGVVLAVGLVSCAGKKDAASKGPAGPVPVTAADVVRKDMPVEIQTFGTVEPYLAVTIKPQVSGVLTNTAIAEGQEVKAGDLLFQLDARPFLADLDKATAALARNQVQKDNADKEAARQDELLKKGLAAQDSFDAAQTAAAALAAAVRADQAALENARLQLDYCSITAPMDGRVGSLVVDPGNLVKANDATLVTINKIRPIKVRFAVPQQELESIMTEMARGTLKVQAVVPTETETREEGVVTFLDNNVDAATGTIKLKGTFANESNRLWPGQFVRIVLVVKVDPQVPVVPAQAVLAGQKGNYVFVIKPDLSVEDRLVTVARRVAEELVIASGLEAGERVVTDGQLRLGPGSRVEVK